MKNLEAHFKEIKKQYPKTMSKDQLYRVAHISKATAILLPKSLTVIMGGPHQQGNRTLFASKRCNSMQGHG